MDIKIVDVAKIAKVSPTTVSRVLNNNPLVKQRTREKVLEVIEAMNYVPHAAAKNLRQQKTMTIGVVVPDVKGSYYAEIIKGIQMKAHSEKYRVIICDTQNDKDIELEYLRLLTDRSVDGMILVATMLNNQEVLGIVDRGYVVGVIGTNIKHPQVIKVNTDNVGAAKAAVTHLIEQGHRNIVFLSGFAEAVDSFERLEGYLKALKEHEIPLRPELLENGNFNEHEGYNAMKRLREKGIDFSAVFAANDEMALGVYRYCKEYGIAIPSQMAVIGFDDDRVCQYLTPPLCTIRQPKFQMGYTIADHMIKCLCEGQNEDRVTVLESELLIRSSTVK